MLKYTEYRSMDKEKKSWPLRGEWDDEPDKVQWVDEDTGLKCEAIRSVFGGYWCGYVGVQPGHPLFECSHENNPIIAKIRVHGGVSFSGKSLRGEKSHLWWFGFDCAHYRDMQPAYKNRSHCIDESEDYCNLSYVKSHCFGLALELKAIEDDEERIAR